MNASKWIPAAAIGLLAAGLLLAPSLAQVQAPAGGATRVAVCDVVQVFNNYARANDLTETLNQKRQEIQAESQKRQQAVENLQQEMQGLLEGSEEYERRFGEIQRMSIDREAWMRHQEGTLMREHHRLTGEMYEEIVKTIEQIAKEGGIDVVLFRARGKIESQNTQQLLQQIEGRKVLYASDGVDLTDTVLTRLNEAYKAGKGR